MALSFRLRGGSKTNYPYAVARVQAKRAKLIPPAQYEKILKMDVNEITRFIEDTTYKAEIDELGARFTGLDLLEAGLTINQERTNASVRSLVKGDAGALVELWLHRFLVQDLKTVLRGKNAGATREELLKELLLEDLDTYNIFQPLLADDVRTPEDVTAALQRQGGVAREWARVLSKIPAESGLSAYEDALDKAFYDHLVQALTESKVDGSSLILEMVRKEIDARNLVNAARWVHAGQKTDFTPYVIPGGRFLNVAHILALSRASDLAGFQDALGDNQWAELVKEGLEAARTSGRLSPFQTAVQHGLETKVGRMAHQKPMSIIPILLFLIQKAREVTVLRAVARGRSAGLSEERLRELIA